MRFLARRKAARLSAPKPTSSIAQVEGSGTADPVETRAMSIVDFASGQVEVAANFRSEPSAFEIYAVLTVSALGAASQG